MTVARRKPAPRGRTAWRWKAHPIQPTRPAPHMGRRVRTARTPRARVAAATVFSLQAIARRYQEQMQRELEQDLARRKREGWER